MRHLLILLSAIGVWLPLCLTAGTVVITSLPDEAHPLDPITALDGIPLGTGTAVRVGAFPGMTDDQILDTAAAGGLAQIEEAFVGFGDQKNIGDGVEGAAGNFEIAVREPIAGDSALVGEEVSLLIQKEGGQEFFVARFKGSLFAADPDTGLEQVLSLHLANANAIVGNRYGQSRLATSTLPANGSFETWIEGFSGIIDPLDRLPTADADGDGRSNFLEYATGTSPVSAVKPQPCQLYSDGGDFWIRFSRASGMGNAQPVVETSGNLISPWEMLDGPLEPDPNPPSAVGLEWMRIRVPLDSEGQPVNQQFFRLRAGS